MFPVCLLICVYVHLCKHLQACSFILCGDADGHAASTPTGARACACVRVATGHPISGLAARHARLQVVCPHSGAEQIKYFIRAQRTPGRHH